MLVMSSSRTLLSLRQISGSDAGKGPGGFAINLCRNFTRGFLQLASHRSYRINSVMAASMPSSVSGYMRLPMICWISLKEGVLLQ